MFQPGLHKDIQWHKMEDVIQIVNDAAQDIKTIKEDIVRTDRTLIALEIGIGIVSLITLIIAVKIVSKKN